MVADQLVEDVAKPNYRTLGPRFGGDTQAVATAITTDDASRLASELRTTGGTSVTIQGPAAASIAMAHPGTVDVSAGPVATVRVPLRQDDVILTQVSRAGWPSAEAADARVSLDVAITPELRREGLAREVIRLVQDARKADGLEVSDRITLRWAAADPDLAAALTEHGQLIAAEVLATEFGPAGDGSPAAPDAGTGHRDADLGLTFWIRRS
jgi:isoleucyl-tRNA synthetase